MACPHCLRGSRRNDTMPEDLLRFALNTLSYEADFINFGGGETLASLQHFKKFYRAFMESNINRKYFEYLWIPTNGLGLMRLPSLRALLIEFASQIGVVVTLGIATDIYHGTEQEKTFKILKNELTLYPNIEVVEHGPTNSRALLNMGRSYYMYGGKDEIIYSDSLDDYYITFDGDVWGSCNLSYNFMSRFKNSPLYFGNITKESIETIDQRRTAVATELENSNSVIKANEARCAIIPKSKLWSHSL